MTDVLLIVGGVVVVGAVAQDVFATVLFPASRRGIIRKPLSRCVWHCFRRVARMTDGQRRRDVLSYGGPAVITIAIAVWFVLLVVGWALMYKPGLGSSISATSGPTDTGWGTAFYYSGVALTTLGIGDLAPSTTGYRLLTFVQAAMGFAVISMVITYFLSVYTSLTARNAFAQGLHQRSRSTGDAAELLAGLCDDDVTDARHQLSDKAAFLRQIHQSHRFYPVLRYFHYREPLYALPRILLIALDSVALVRTVIDQDRYAKLSRSRAVEELHGAATALLDELLQAEEAPPAAEEETAAWRSRYDRARERLADAGYRLRHDSDAAGEEYVKLRATWDGRLQSLADSLGYEWEAVVPRDDGGGSSG